MENRCNGCMRIKGPEPRCGYCGYLETQQNASHQLPVGTLLQGQYRIGRVLGQGGFGITYLGWDTRLDSPVAIKEYYPGSQVSRSQGTTVLGVTDRNSQTYQEGKERFLREARTLAKLRHQHSIVQVHNFFAQNNTAYIVMEYVEGVTLKEHVRSRGGKLSCQETFAIMRPIFHAMEQVHQAGMIHRDISPDNIMLCGGDMVKLLDFGTARDMEEGQLTHSTQAVLKRGYAPMEQYSWGRALDQRADEYALCCTMYYCLTGKRPLDAMNRFMDRESIPWGQIPGLTPRQAAALEKGTALHAEDRFPDLKSLEQALFPEAVPASKPAKTPKPQRKKRPGLWAALLLLTAALLAGAGIWWSTQDRSGIPPVSIAAGGAHTIGLRRDGTVLAVGDDSAGACQTDQWAQVVAVAAGARHTVGLKSDGTVVAVGDDTSGRCQVSGWQQIIAVAAGEYHTVGLKADGTVVAVGGNRYGQCEVAQWRDIVAIAAGVHHTVGLKADGTVVATGNKAYGQCLVYEWENIVAVAAGGYHTVGLKADGTVVTAGSNGKGQCNTDQWQEITAIAAGYTTTVGLKMDGTVVSIGDASSGQQGVSQWENIVAIVAGKNHIAGVKSDGTAVAVGDNSRGQCSLEAWSKLCQPQRRS